MKHEGHHKTKMSMPRVDVESFFLSKDSIHVNNERCYIVVDRLFILHRLQTNVPFEQRHKHVQFVVFHLISHGHPMSDY